MENSAMDTPTSIDNQSIKQTTEVKFYGKTGEFFAIWIVNLLLSIVTLGIYSAWAKVRTNRYFYSNTEIDGHRFSYLADPIQILKGRIIGVILFGAYFLASAFSPILALVIMLLLLAATPFLICLSIRFNMRMTAYRNVRFNFNGSFGDAFIMFVLLPIASIFTLYLMMPWVLKKMDEYIYANITFGNKEVKTDLKTGEYYIASFGALIIAAALFAVAIFAMGGTLAALQDPEMAAQMPMSMLFIAVVYMLVIFLASSFYTARIRNHIFNHSNIDEVASFKSELGVGQLVWLHLSNFVALVCTLGFAMPWAHIRSAKLYADATQVNVLTGADKVLADESGSASAVAEEVAGVFDVDIALG
ncbi:YjgN family protein [Paraglaciecola aquimarina]|uniref:YjgN family protein n=1 Tax=Paraglaciecola aquimarina TaxID=1235557 RepID=A0ABU3T210_9ALTE|nr:YjgN family protein [Paraglaciecola aquimarina]MDU0356299.1 YjgN family protein [Paraglaciecola aquimarina]